MDFWGSNFVGLITLHAVKARFRCQVEVTVLEVEMADDCVSTSALRCFGSSFRFPQNPLITFYVL